MKISKVSKLNKDLSDKISRKKEQLNTYEEYQHEMKLSNDVKIQTDIEKEIINFDKSK